jgi:hypothetical protein
MDVERVIEFILDQQAKNEVQAAKNEAEFAATKADINATKADINKISGMIAQMGAIQLRAEEMLESLIAAQSRTEAAQLRTDQAIQALATKQAITEEKLQGLIDAMRRNQNGHT